MATAAPPQKPGPDRSDLRGEIGVRLPEDLEIAILRLLQSENSKRFYPMTLSDLTRIALIEYANNRGFKVEDTEPIGRDVPTPARRRGLR